MVRAGQPQSQKQLEFLFCQPCLFKDVSESRAFDRAMRRDGQLKRFSARVLVHTNMAAPLADDYPTVPLKSFDNLFVAQSRELGHIAISTTSAPGVEERSSSTGSR